MRRPTSLVLAVSFAFALCVGSAVRADDSAIEHELKEGSVVAPGGLITVSKESSICLRYLGTGGFASLAAGQTKRLDTRRPVIVIRVRGTVTAKGRLLSPVELADFVCTLGGAVEVARPGFIAGIFSDAGDREVLLGETVPPKFLGLVLTPATGSHPKYVVRGTEPGSPAARSGIVAGDVLASVNDVIVEGPSDDGAPEEQFRVHALEAALDGRDAKVSLTFNRAGEEVRVQLDATDRPTSKGHLISNRIGSGCYATILITY